MRDRGEHEEEEEFLKKAQSYLKSLGSSRRKGRKRRWSACYVSFRGAFAGLLNLCHGAFLSGSPEAVSARCTTYRTFTVQKLIQLLTEFVSHKWKTPQRETWLSAPLIHSTIHLLLLTFCQGRLMPLYLTLKLCQCSLRALHQIDVCIRLLQNKK